MLLYPETHGVLKSILFKPAAAAINFSAAAVQTLYGVLRTPLNWAGKIPGLKWLKSEKQHVNRGIKGMSLSIVELTGFRMRYPKPTPWRSEEEDFIYNDLPDQEPKILNFLLERVQQ